MKTCQSCEAPIVWLRTQAGKAMPVDAASVRPGDTIFVPNLHVSHFATCPHAAKHRKPRQGELFGGGGR